MEKGILHIKKKPRHIKSNGKDIPIKKEVPEIGKEFDKMECEFDGVPAVKIIVGGKVFTADLEALEAKKEKAKEADEFKRAYEDILRRQESSGDSFSLIKARIPKDTRECLIEDGDNFFLKFNQFAHFNDEDNKFYHFKMQRGRGFQIKPNFGNLFETEMQLSERLFTSAKTLFSAEGQLIASKFRPDWRFVTGLGGHSVYETGFTLHHIYGIPYIPASSIKGVLRSWVIYSKFGNNEGRAISECEDFCKVFGCPAEVKVEREGLKPEKYQSIFKQARQGKVTFFDALPTISPTIEPDIMNPHYGDWYGEKKDRNGNFIPPTDTQSPVPVFFLTVKNTPFQFLLGSKTWNLETEKFWDGQTLGWWLKEALEEHGIGAKTAVGYGYMKPA